MELTIFHILLVDLEKMDYGTILDGNIGQSTTLELNISTTISPSIRV